MVEQLKYVDLDALRYFMRGLSFNAQRCAEVADHVLIGLNERERLPDAMLQWIRAGGISAGPGPTMDGCRLILEIVQSHDRSGKTGYFAMIKQSVERQQTPVVFLSMHSPTLNVPMRVELPLRAVMNGNPPPNGTHTLYLHSLLTDLGETFSYYGITKRGWNLRFAEHTRDAFSGEPRRLMSITMNDLIAARLNQLRGIPDDRPKLAGIVSSVCGSGMTREQSLQAEEELVGKYSLASEHPFGLNMVPGGLAGVRPAQHFARQPPSFPKR